MRVPTFVDRMRLTTPMVVLASLFVGAGGGIHLREWLEVYRLVPANAPGSAVVRIGFPVNAAVSLLFVVALILVSRRRSRVTLVALIGAVAFQVTSLAALVLTRVDALFGWAEPTWSPGAQQIAAVEVAAIVSLLVLAAFRRVTARAADLNPAAG